MKQNKKTGDSAPLGHEDALIKVDFKDDGVVIDEKDVNDSRITDVDKQAIDQINDSLKKDTEISNDFEKLLEQTANAQVEKKGRKSIFPPKPKLVDWNDPTGNRSKENAPYALHIMIHTTKGYDALNGRKAKGRVRSLPNIFEFAASSSLVIDYALKVVNHITALQLLITLEAYLDELQQAILNLDAHVKGLVEKMSEFGMRTRKIKADRPTDFKLVFKNPYATKLAILILQYDHIERTLLPIRGNDMITAKEYFDLHKSISSIINRIKSLPEIFSKQKQFNNEYKNDPNANLAELLDLSYYVKFSLEAKNDEKKMLQLKKLQDVIGVPSRELVEGKIKPTYVPSIKPIDKGFLNG